MITKHFLNDPRDSLVVVSMTEIETAVITMAELASPNTSLKAGTLPVVDLLSVWYGGHLGAMTNISRNGILLFSMSSENSGQIKFPFSLLSLRDSSGVLVNVVSNSITIENVTANTVSITLHLKKAIYNES